MTRHLVLEAEAPSTRTIKRWKRAIAAKQTELGVRVMFTAEEIRGGTAHGG